MVIPYMAGLNLARTDNSMLPRKILPVFKPQLLTLLLFVLPAGNVSGAGNESPFDTLEIGLKYVVNTNRNVFHDYWTPGQGVDVSIATPFYYGIVQAGVQAFPFYARDKGISDFQDIYVYLNWGLRWSPVYKLEWLNYIGVGSHIMVFEREVDYERYESELGLCLGTGVSYPVRQNLEVYLAGCYNLIFTHKRIELLFLLVGISHSLAMPSPLKAFLE